MCRNIKTLFNLEPPVTEAEIRAASVQFVRKLSGFNKPSKANEVAFLAAIDEIAAISSKLLSSLTTNAAPKNRTEQAAKARAPASQRFVKCKESLAPELRPPAESRLAVERLERLNPYALLRHVRHHRVTFHLIGSSRFHFHCGKPQLRRQLRA